MVIACIALGVALSGTGIAATVALAPNSVGTLQIKANAVTTQKVKNGTLLRGDFKAGQVPRGPAGPPGAAGVAGPAGPAGAAGPAGPSDAYARFLTGRSQSRRRLTTLANLSIPQAGKYVIWAKAYHRHPRCGVATCRLVAGTDADEIQTQCQCRICRLEGSQSRRARVRGRGKRRLQVPGDGTVQANHIRVAAIKVANLTNG